MTVDELEAFVKQLRSEGIAARHAQVGDRNQNGMDVMNEDGSSEFFPLYELNDPLNRDLLLARNFAGINARRKP